MPANYVLLERQILTANAASVLLDQIPTTGYTDLKLVVSARGSYAGGTIALIVRPNSNSSNTTARVLYGDGSSAATFGDTIVYGNIPAANATSNTYGVSEFHIFNYSSSNAKGFLADGYTGNRATSALNYFTAARWDDSTAISSLYIAASSGDLVAGSEFSIYGLAAVGTTPAISPFATGGDIIVKDSSYYYHAFLSSGTFTPLKNLTCDYLVVAGGGGGGSGQGGGGGAGGLRSTVTATGGGGSLPSARSFISETAYSITIGAGGVGSSYGSQQGIDGTGSSITGSGFTTISTTGGGGGGGNASQSLGNGRAGGSGGGGSADYATTGGSGTANEGYAGGAGEEGISGNRPSGGGGGAGQAGIAGVLGNSGNGGNGVQITALATPTLTGADSGYYAGGGSGGGSASGGSNPGGLGGGGAGSTGTGTNAVINTGSGGGGSANNQQAGNGANGIVIIRYAIA